MNRTFDLATSFLASALRAGLGARVGRLGPRPERPIELYEFEACPFCRKVREALSVLDLEAVIYPCPKGGTRYRERMRRLGGRLQFPYLVDPNAGVSMYESDDIVSYLFRTYGDGPPPLLLRLGPLGDAGASLATALRPTKGIRARPSRLPERPLELWSFEASPFCRLVREALTELELPYLLHNVAKESPNRSVFVRRSGRMMVPYLADPNTGKEMFESDEIVAFLRATYCA